MIEITWETLPYILLHVAVAALGVARLTRVIVYDDFPPAMWWRETWVRITNGNAWAKLFLCWWCLAFWVALACIGWWIGGLYALWAAWAWWIFWGALALGYLAPMIIVRDEPDSK
jgi:hypothetical protein